MFYTAIGQQQLFFNVLAALDQADYVETALQRKALKDKQAAVATEPKFTAEAQPLVRESSISGQQQEEECPPTGQGPQVWPSDGTPCSPPGLKRTITTKGSPALLNRPVTLEGGDAYTDQLVREFGAESARRNSLSELLRTLCDFGLGIKNCGYSAAGDTLTGRKAELYRFNSMVINPLSWFRAPLLYGAFAVLNSGYPGKNVPNPDPDTRQAMPYITDQEFRQGRMAKPDRRGPQPRH